VMRDIHGIARPLSSRRHGRCTLTRGVSSLERARLSPIF
jgi:hypothetical protein